MVLLVARRGKRAPPLLTAGPNARAGPYRGTLTALLPTRAGRYWARAPLQSVRPAAVVQTYGFPHALIRYAVSVPRLHSD
jgi:hypothetical protein